MNATVVRRRLVAISVLGNLLGAVLTFLYFQFVDYGAGGLGKGVTPEEVAYFVVAFAALVAAGRWQAWKWARPLFQPHRLPPAEHDALLVRRRALLLPYMSAANTLVGWVLAGVIWGVVWLLLADIFTVENSGRLVFGITGIGGTVTAAFIFFAVEHHWRKVLPTFFPEGNLSAVSGVVKLPVRARLLVIFLMMGIVPLSVLGVVSYTRAVALLQADQAAAAQLVTGMLVIILFIVAVGIAAAIGLSMFVAESVAAPLRELGGAMGRVKEGDLDSRCPVVTNDEIGGLTEGFNRMLDGLKEREFVKETFGKYVSREIRDEILAGRITLEGSLREVTILFADLRDFTPWVEATPPREVVRDLNAYFTEMDTAIRGHRGLVLQFIGDEIEAVFGAPVAYPAHAEMAVRAAVEMRRRLLAWNGQRHATGKRPLRHGIGIHTGTVLAGNIGSSERLSYALVGDPVNLASRIQNLNKEVGSDILISGATRRLLNGSFELTPLPAVKVKGKSAEVEVYRVV
jgi:adenylate cyclase